MGKKWAAQSLGSRSLELFGNKLLFSSNRVELSRLICCENETADLFKRSSPISYFKGFFQHGPSYALTMNSLFAIEVSQHQEVYYKPISPRENINTLETIRCKLLA